MPFLNWQYPDSQPYLTLASHQPRSQVFLFLTVLLPFPWFPPHCNHVTSLFLWKRSWKILVGVYAEFDMNTSYD